MPFHFLATALLVALPSLALAQAESSKAPTVQPGTVAPLPVEAFAALPFVEQAHISPDGLHVAGLFGIGEQRILIMPIAGDRATSAVVAMPEDTQPGAIQWVGNDNIIVTLTGLLPVEGDRWYVSRMIAINRTTRKVTKLLWDLAGQNSADVLHVPSDGSTEILVAGQNSIYTNDDEFWPKVYRVDVVTGKKRSALAGRPGVMDWGADHLGNVRIGLSYSNNSLTSRLLYRADGTGTFKIADKSTYGDGSVLTVPFTYLPGGDNALVMRDNAAGMTGIFEVNLATLETVKTVYQPEKGEVTGAIRGDDGSLLGAHTTDRALPVKWFDPALANLQENFAKSVPNSRVTIESINADRSKMLVRIDSAESPGSLYYFDTEGGVLRRMAVVNEKIGSRKLSPVKMIQYKARDGLEIEAVLTIPKGGEPKNLPFIVMPHGGPWAHDTLTYDYWAQFLASRGYVVLQPNFRGSTGYGTDFIEKGKGQMGLAMQDDVSDGVAWAVTQGIADPKRVCIVGASYGGYAAMWGIAKDPDLYRCAISISGVAALRREVNDFGDALRGNLYKKQWQEMTPDFNAVSPINAVARIKAPLMLIHGKRDITVDHVQSVKMNNAMTKAGKQVELVSLPFADHYFARQEDRGNAAVSDGPFPCNA